MRGLSIMMRAPRCVSIYRIETCHFLEAQDRPVQCPERAPEYEGGEQPRKFAVMGHDAGGGDFASTVIAFIKLSYRQLRNALVKSWLMEEADACPDARRPCPQTA